MEKIDIAIIGAGVVGLAVGAQLAKKGRLVYVIERHSSFGQETSSRNSEVIHAGIYYTSGTLKAKTCVEGNKLLYEICGKNKIPHKRCGKLIVANTKDEENILYKLFENARSNGVKELKILTKEEIKKMESEITAEAALYSESTGIIDSHSLMEYFIQKMKENEAEVVYNSEVVALEKSNARYKLTIKERGGDTFGIQADIVINSAGLESDVIASKLGIDIKKQGYELKYCKGQYFRVSSNKARLLSHLVYPVPQSKSAGLGIHATLDLAGGLRLGPDDKYIEKDKVDAFAAHKPRPSGRGSRGPFSMASTELSRMSNPESLTSLMSRVEWVDYNVDINDRDKFFDSAKSFLPFLEKDDLMPDIAGIRPKLQAEGEPERDFLIKEETDLGFPGFVNLIGIESPGLTSAISIARYVERLF